MLKDTGASVRIYNLAKSLAGLGNNVHVVIPGDEATLERDGRLEIDRIKGLCPNPVLEFFSNLLGVLRPTSLFFYDFLFILRTCRIILKSNVIQIEQPWSSGPIILLLTKIFRKPLVIDSHDVFQALRVNKNSLRKIVEVFLEKIAYKCANLILIVSEKDMKYLIKYGIQQDKIVIIPNGVDTEKFTPLLDTAYIRNRYDLKDFHMAIFVGNMEYLPNREAVRVIEQELAPRVQSKVKNVKFLVVGRAPPGFGCCNLILTGVVENVAEYLAASDVAIAPLFHGSGTRLKILEYFSCALPVVSTSVGIEGLEVKNGENVLIEDDMNKFAVKITKLLEDKALSARIGKAARELVISKYDWKKIGEKLNTACFFIRK